MLQLSAIIKEYGSRPILSIPSFSFASGIYWIKGGNGSGKTTLLKILAGLVPFRGEVILNGTTDLRKHAISYRQLVNYAEAEPLYPSFLSGVDLIALYEASKGAAKVDVDRLISRFDIGGFVAQPIGTYSSGMVKKLSLMLAFVGSPKVILLDEPLVTLEDRAIPVLTELIKQYQSAQEVTFILTSHQQMSTASLPNLCEIEMREQTLWQ